MYAVVSTGGKQLKVEKGSEAVVEKLDTPVGDTVTMDVLFVADGDAIVTDNDALAGATVTAEVVEHFLGEKQVVFKFKRRKGYKRLKGHRQPQTRVVITDIAYSAPKKKAAKKAEPKPVEETKAAVAEEKPEKVAKAEKPAKAEKKPAKAAEVKEAPAKAEKKPAKAPEAPKAQTAPAQCEAIKADGERCHNKAKEGSKYCGVHAKKYDN